MKPEEQDGQAQEQEMRILELAEQYTPDQAAQWKEELAKRAELREQLHKYKNSKKYRKKQEEIKQELKQKLDSGEMTQEDLKKMIQQKKKEFAEKHRAWKEEGSKLQQQLEQALAEKNEQEIAAALNAMLKRLQQSNQRMTEKLQSLK